TFHNSRHINKYTRRLKIRKNNVLRRYVSTGRRNGQPLINWGDSNVLLNSEEKIGGLPMVDSELLKINDRVENDCIFGKQDRVLTNQGLQGWFDHMEVEHLVRTN
ncbi:hypothetical protein H5410_025971, partial [Solanum commersonii]